MRWPSLRLPLPRVSFSFDWLDALGGRRFLLYALYTLLLFAVFVVVNFPHDVVVQRALRAVDLGPVALGVGGTRFAWYKGYELRGVQLKQRSSGPESPPILESTSLYVRPGLDGLLRGQLSSVYVSGALYNGAVDARWTTSDGMMRATLELRDVQLERYRFLTSLFEEGQVGGKISGTVTVESRRNDWRSGRAAGGLELQGASATAVKVRGFGMPDLHFDTASVKFALQNNRLDVQEFRADGDAKLSGDGQIVLRNPVQDSVLNLRVSIVPGTDSPDAIKGLLQLIPRGQGARPDAPVAISGTLRSPRLR